MAETNDFDRINGWVGRLQTCVDQANQEKAATETLLDSAEYELLQLRRQLMPSPKSGAPITKVAEPGHSPAGVFNIKLRNPENFKNPQWWAVLGLNQ